MGDKSASSSQFQTTKIITTALVVIYTTRNTEGTEMGFINQVSNAISGSSGWNRYDDKERTDRLLDEYSDLFYITEDDGSQYELNERQKEAVVKLGKHNQVVAGAGTGKTFSLAFRAKFLVEHGVAPHDIVALTFTRDAASVMEQRLSGTPDERLFEEPVNADTRTLHSLGASILREVYEFEQLVGAKQHALLEDTVADLWQQNPEFRETFETFREELKQRRFDSDEPEAIKSFFYSHRSKSGSLAGDELPKYPRQEQTAHETIADFLFKHGIAYRYQQVATEVTKTNNQPYFRLFRLPEHNLTIEYVLPEHARQQKKHYNRRPGAAELKRIHGGLDTDVIVIEHKHLFDGKRVDTELLEQHLRDQLQQHDINFSGGDEYEAYVPEITDFYNSQQADREQWRVYCYNKLWTDIIEEFADFVNKAKENQNDPHEELRQADKADYEDVVWSFSQCAATVSDEYANRLEKRDIYDFSDLIIEATKLLENPPASLDPTRFAYKHVMVDEFQDLNLTQLEMIQALLNLDDEVCLFVIGDDWQSIYGFKAAKPEYFIDFDDHFMPCTRTELQVNYRCDEEITESGNTLIANNDNQIDKSVTAASDNSGEIYVHTIPSTDSYTDAAINQIADLVENSAYLHSIGNNQRGGDIMVLARTRAGSPYIRRVRQELRQRNIKVGDHEEEDAVTVNTAHSAKGEEAEHVIAAHATETSGGFPMSEQLSLQELIETRPSGEEHIEEERRLFYVVLTRGKSRVDIQTSDDSPSRFISEIRKHVQFDSLGDPTELESLQSAEGDRVSVAGTVVDQYTQNVGCIRTESFADESFSHLTGETLNYVQFTDKEPSEGDHVDLTNTLVNEYEGDLQLKIDSQASFSLGN